jgi:hypothetical protein
MGNSEGHSSEKLEMDYYRYISVTRSALPCKFALVVKIGGTAYNIIRMEI